MCLIHMPILVHVLKTIYNILNVPYVNQFDVTASLLQDFFTPVPDYTPYTMELHDSRIFDAELAMKKYNRTIDWRKIEQGPPLDNEDVEREVHYRNKYQLRQERDIPKFLSRCRNEGFIHGQLFSCCGLLHC